MKSTTVKRVQELRSKGYHSFSIDGDRPIILSAFNGNAKQATDIDSTLTVADIDVLVGMFPFVANDRD